MTWFYGQNISIFGGHLEIHGNLLKINRIHFLTGKLQNLLKIIETQRKIFSGTTLQLEWEYSC